MESNFWVFRTSWDYIAPHLKEDYPNYLPNHLKLMSQTYVNVLLKYAAKMGLLNTVCDTESEGMSDALV